MPASSKDALSRVLLLTGKGGLQVSTDDPVTEKKDTPEKEAQPVTAVLDPEVVKCFDEWRVIVADVIKKTQDTNVEINARLVNLENAISAITRSFDQMAEIMRRPVRPIYDKNGRLAGAQRD